MTSRRRIAAALTLLLVIAVGSALAQQWRGGRFGGGRPMTGALPDDRAGVPDWEVDERFERDVFTFVRVQYSSQGGYGRRRGWGAWLTDFPDSDLNFSYRLQQLTSLKVNPNPITLELTDDRLFDYPFIYLIEPGRGGIWFTDQEAERLRRYLLNGGFLMVDDFWGNREYEIFYRAIKHVFPDREPQELDLDHPVFRIVYRLNKKPQVPSIEHAFAGRSRGITWEGGPDTMTPHYQGIFDDDGRMMVIICHNTDLGDGWEEEGVDPWYFKEFAEKLAYPMGINIVTYAMTH